MMPTSMEAAGTPTPAPIFVGRLLVGATFDVGSVRLIGALGPGVIGLTALAVAFVVVLEVVLEVRLVEVNVTDWLDVTAAIPIVVYILPCAKGNQPSVVRQPWSGTGGASSQTQRSFVFVSMLDP